MRSMKFLLAALALSAMGWSSHDAGADEAHRHGKSEARQPPSNLAREFGATLPDKDLGALRGGQDSSLSNMNVNALLNSNSAVADTTGDNIVTQDAFSGAKGFSTVIQNSGNNVIIQNATILNLRLQ